MRVVAELFGRDRGLHLGDDFGWRRGIRCSALAAWLRAAGTRDYVTQGVSGRAQRCQAGGHRTGKGNQPQANAHLAHHIVLGHVAHKAGKLVEGLGATLDRGAGGNGVLVLLEDKLLDARVKLLLTHRRQCVIDHEESYIVGGRR